MSTDFNLSGVVGRLEAQHHASSDPKAPAALVLHEDPKIGGHMNAHASHALFHAFRRRNFSILRFNFRSVGRSTGSFENGPGELEDSTCALDWLQTHHPEASQCWIAGHGFGAWIALQLLMRRPEISRFIAIAPPVERLDFSFLAPCPTEGLIVIGENDTIVNPEEVRRLAGSLHTHEKNYIHFHSVPNAGHLFQKQHQALQQAVENYLAEPPPPPALPKPPLELPPSSHI